MPAEPDPPRRRSLALPVAVFAALLLLFARVLSTGRSTYSFLLWNLALALAPLPVGTLAVSALRQGSRRGRALGAALSIPWLALFPNAPYLVTDFVHLHRRGEWSLLDVAMMTAFAIAGWLAGVRSLVQWAALVDARRSFGRRPFILVAIVSLLSGYGVYVGRVHRLNSWDLALEPGKVFDTLARISSAEFGATTACAGLVASALVATTSLALRRS